METMANKQDTLMDLMTELRKSNEEKDVMIAQLEGRISDLEQYTRMNDIIVTGIKTRPRSFANAVRNRAVEEGADRSTQEFVSVEQQVVEYLKNKGMDINSVMSPSPPGRRGQAGVNYPEVCKQEIQKQDA